MRHLGESQGVPKCLSPYEKIPKLQISKPIQLKTRQTREGKNQAKKRGQKPGCHKPPPLRMNLVLEIRLLGKTILDNVPLEILPVPKLILTLCDAPTEPCRTSLLDYE